MEAITTNKRLHPLLVAAAISVTVFSAVGVAAITGLIPHSKGSAAESSLSAIPPEVARPVEPAIAHPVEATPAPVAQPRPAVKNRKVAAAPKPASPTVYSEYPQEPRVVAQAPQAAEVPPAVEAPKPIPAGQLGVVQSVREVAVAGDTKGVGAVGGAAIGALAGNLLGKHTGSKTAMMVLGGAAGGFAGNAIEKRQRETKQWEIAVRFDDGSSKTLTSPSAPFWHAGDRVRMLDGKLQPV